MQGWFTLFRYFPNKIALVFDEATLLPEMLQAIGERPPPDRPNQAFCEGIIDFAVRHRDVLLVLRPPASPALLVAGQQRTLIDFEESLVGILRQRYSLSANNQLTAAVWAQPASVRCAPRLPEPSTTHSPTAPPGTPVADTIRAYFTVLTVGLAKPRHPRSTSQRSGSWPGSWGPGDCFA